MKDHNKNIIITIVFSLFIFSLFIINIVKKDTLISKSERRKLAQFPEFSSKSLFDGTFFHKFDNYATDQFFQRDKFRLLKVIIELKTKHNYNDLYVYNDYIIKQTYPLSETSISRLTKKINYLKENYLKNNEIYFSIIPDKNYYVSNGNLKLDYSKMEEMLKTNLSYANYIDIFNTLSIENYYKTDTHWKQETLIDVANKFAHEMNFNISNSYQKEKITKFLGVYAGQLPIKNNYEDINILINDSINNSKVYNYETKKTTQVYDLTKINSIDKYDIYLSGATPLITITNELSDNTKELIVFRDSYGSSLIPLFISGYKKITMIDTRYISPKILNRYIEFNNQDVLFLYSALLINDSSSLK